MITIPSQLSKCRFILTNKKIPIEKNWTTTANYTVDDDTFTKHLQENNTYGVCGGYNKIIILDFDNRDLQEKVVPLLPPTFAVKTAGKGLLHLYYFSDDCSSFKYLDEEDNTLIDFQGIGKMVIGPGSIIGTKAYTVIEDREIATIEIEKVKDIFKEFIHIEVQDKHGGKDKLSDEVLKLLDTDPVVKDIKSKYPVTKLLQKFNITIPTGNKHNTMCPLGHTSVGGLCFSYNKDATLWKCFHCSKGGDIFSLYMNYYGVDFIKAKEDLYRELYIEGNAYEKAMQNLYNRCVLNKSMDSYIIQQVADLMIKNYNFNYTIETKNLYYYNNNEGIYKIFGESIIHKDIEKYFKEYAKTAHVNEIINKIQRITVCSVELFTSGNKFYIPLKNGVWDIVNKKLLPKSPEFKFIYQIPVEYNPLAKISKIDKFINEVVIKDNVELMYEIFGFVLLPHYHIQKAILLVGNGSNGKSVYLNLLRVFLGEKNVSAEPLQNLASTSGYSMFSLFGKVANICPDLPATKIMDSSKFKELTSGHDYMTAEQKFHDRFQFVNNAKLIFSCNEVPATQDETKAYARRWIIVQFPFTFEGKSADKNLIDKLTTTEELSGLLNVALEKMYKLLESNEFTYSKTDEQVRELYMNLANPLGVFIIDRIERGNYTINKRELFDAYTSFCVEKTFAPLTYATFNSKLTKELKLTETRTTVKGEREFHWVGITLKEKVGNIEEMTLQDMYNE